MTYYGPPASPRPGSPPIGPPPPPPPSVAGPPPEIPQATRITVGAIRRPTSEERGGTGRPQRARSDSGLWLEARLPTIVAIGLATGALVAPGIWVLVCAIAGLALRGVTSVQVPSARRGAADLLVLPARGLGHALSPGNFIKGLVRTSFAAVCGVVLPGALAAARWLITDGPSGAQSAGRISAYASGARCAAAVVCYTCLRPRGNQGKALNETVKRWTARLTEPGITLVAGVLGVGILGLVVAAPRTSVGSFSGADGLGFVPAALREQVDSVRDAVVKFDARKLSECLSERQQSSWDWTYSAKNPLGADDVIRLATYSDTDPTAEEAITAALAAHNYLPPWVEIVEVASRGTLIFSIDRRLLPHSKPIDDARVLPAAAVAGKDWLRIDAIAPKLAGVLPCSAPSLF